MKRLLSLLTIFVLLAAAGLTGLPASAQQSKPLQDPFAAPRDRRKEIADKMPAVVGRAKSPEAKAAFEKLPPELRDLVKSEVDKIIQKEDAKFQQQRREQKSAQQAAPKTLKDTIKGKQSDTDINTSLGFTDSKGNRQLFKAKERDVDTIPFNQVGGLLEQQQQKNRPVRSSAQKPYAQAANAFRSTSGAASIRKASFVKTSASMMVQGGGDGDFDGLPEDFENALADLFTPIYHVSAFDVNNYATFNNSLPQSPMQLYGPNPISHFRVQPLGFTYNSANQLVSVLRVDYLTLWDYDNGLVTGGGCSVFPGLDSLEGSRSHPIDNERSAALVAAPVADFNYNLDPWAYSAYDYYTAAHEGEPNSKSAYHTPWQPVPAGWHLHLAQSLSKHATYTYNPDYLSLLPDWVIFGILAGADAACYFAAFDSWTDWHNYVCLASIYYAYGAIFECAVERFVDQGGRFADMRINVGEPSNPINGSAFIQDNTYGLYGKLINPVWTLN
ncbi:MAG: hypothetical protein WBV94_09875 [Blastocatellia bacterium]